MLVSIIIPCFNVEEYINDCVQSVLSQEYRDIEIICIDNNSTDDTWEVLKGLKNDYPSLIIDQELNPGACSARNKGMKLAKGEWLQFLDADDLLEPEKISHQVEIVNLFPNLDFVAGAYKRKQLNELIKVAYPYAHHKLVSAFINQCGNTCSNLWNGNTLKKIGGWSENLASSQETDLMLRIIISGGSYEIDNVPLTIIRERESGQISQQNPVKRWKQYIEVRLNYLKDIQEKFPSDYKKFKNKLYDFLMVSVLTLAKYDKPAALSYYKNHIKANWKTDQTFGFNYFKYYFLKFFGLRFFLMLK